MSYDRTLKDFLNFRHANGCQSVVGRDGGAQDLGLAPFCAEEHTLIHEVNIIIFQNSTKMPCLAPTLRIYGPYFMDLLKLDEKRAPDRAPLFLLEMLIQKWIF